MAIGDMDNDGCLDAVVTVNDGPAHLIPNEIETSNHWLTLLLVGHRSNRDAIGAEVKLVTTHGFQLTTITTSGGYLSANDKRAHLASA